MLGSTAIQGAVDASLFLYRSSNNVRTLRSRQRYGTDIDNPIVVDLGEDTGWVSTSGTAHQTQEKNLEAQILEYLDGLGRAAQTNEIKSAVRGKGTAIMKILEQMTSAGVLTSCHEAHKRGKPIMSLLSG